MSEPLRIYASVEIGRLDVSDDALSYELRVVTQQFEKNVQVERAELEGGGRVSYEERFPRYGVCEHVKRHHYVVRDEHDAVMLMFLRLAGWFDGTGYCPAYFPQWLGGAPVPTISEEEYERLFETKQVIGCSDDENESRSATSLPHEGPDAQS